MAPPHSSRCSIENCTRPLRGRGWCSLHYQRWKRLGDPLGGDPRRSRTPTQLYERRRRLVLNATRYAKKNREKINAANRRRYKENPNKIKARYLRHRAGGHVTAKQLAVIETRTGGRCSICKKLVNSKDRSIDHIVPVANGGRSNIENLTLAHRACNSSRGAGRIPGQLWLV